MGGAELAVLVAAAIGAAGASGTAWIVARRSSRDALRAARRDAYRQVLRLCHEVHRWTHATHPMVSYTDVEPDGPSAESRIDAQALVDLYGSDDVRERFSDWAGVYREFIGDATTISTVKMYKANGISVSDELAVREVDAWRVLPELRDKMERTIDDLAAAMRADTGA